MDAERTVVIADGAVAGPDHGKRSVGSETDRRRALDARRVFVDVKIIGDRPAVGTEFPCVDAVVETAVREPSRGEIAVRGHRKIDVLLRFGAPSTEFEDGRILTYRLVVPEDGEPQVVAREVSLDDPRIAHWREAQYSLVLVFGDDHVLAQHALIRVR